MRFCRCLRRQRWSSCSLLVFLIDIFHMSNSDSDVGCAACVCPFSFCALFLPQQLTCVCVCVWADIGGVAVLAMCINNSKSFMQISVKQDRGGERKGSLTVIAARCKSSSQEQYLCVCVCCFLSLPLCLFLIIVLFGVFRLPLRCMRQRN